MKFISLFAGIGGLDLGLERAGMECVAQVEINDFCQKILTKHWAHVPKFKDVKDVGKQNLPAADLICGGFPCQPHSLAGKRKASSDDRDLWGEYARIIGECQPEWVLAENVPGLLSSENGRFFGRVLRELDASGYDVEWQSISAAAFGAPHIRERVYIVAHRKSEGERRVSVFWKQERQGDDVDGICQEVSNAHGKRRKEQRITKPAQAQFCGIERNSQWETEPRILRVVDGLPNRVDRIAGLGNAVVPQAAEYIGRLIKAATRPTQREPDLKLRA
jgi:DNA (cytosine-5)-methyltransferase 1